MEKTMMRQSAKKKLGSAWPATAMAQAEPVDPGVLPDRGHDAERDRQAEREGDGERQRAAPSSGSWRRSAPTPACGNRATWPKSPDSVRPSHSRYCTTSGRSRPYCCRTFGDVLRARALTRDGDGDVARQAQQQHEGQQRDTLQRSRDEPAAG
jgi:hypothetical protein